MSRPGRSVIGRGKSNRVGQVQVPDTRRTLDLVGVLTHGTPTLVAIEVKRYPDNRIQNVPKQLHDYLDILDPERTGLREDVATSYRIVCGQLRRLGRPAPAPERMTPGMRVEGLVIVSDYDSNSELLPRAHRLATGLERPIHLWQPKSGESAIPPSDQWLRMGCDHQENAQA